MTGNGAAIGPWAVVVRSAEPVDADVDGAVVMMSLRRGKYYGLDPVGSRIWKLLDAPVQVSALCDRLRDEFDVDPATCEQDVLEFLEGLAGEGLIEVRHGEAG